MRRVGLLNLSFRRADFSSWMPSVVPTPAFVYQHPLQQRRLRKRLRVAVRDTGLVDLSPEHSSPEKFWDLDPSPLIVGAEEWVRLEAALIQRARFVNALLVDVYGKQRVLTERLLPPEVVLADPYYRRPCLGIERNRLNPAAVLRFDLIQRNGVWHFSETHANTPIGLGFAVQNRRFLSQEANEFYASLPDYHSIVNAPLRLLDALRSLAPSDDRPASIVVLTAGPHDPFYTEHSFLARKMGLPLARGDDLLVLDNCVYFKTIAGLERVDVIYRRLNDAHIDPVVFSTDRETAGVPGLLQSIRTGNVAVANSIGAGVADNRVIDAYLPRMMRAFLGEAPLLPSVPTLTCGDTDHLDQILGQAADYTILPAHAYRVGDSQLQLPRPKLLKPRGVAAIVRENPHAFVARPLDSVEPAAGELSRLCLSAYVLSIGGQFRVLPGGLVRLGGTQPPVDRIGPCADVVVLQGTTVSVDEGPDVERPGARRQHALGSRAAENLFWLGRYLERSEATARMLSIFNDVALEEIPAADRRHWVPLWRGLLEATGHAGEKITARENPRAALTGDLMWRMTLSGDHPSSIAASVYLAAENARQLRDYVSPEAWVILSRLSGALDELRPSRPSHELRIKAAIAAVQHVLVDINAFLGTAERTMLMDAGWQFLRIGLHLERAIMTCSTLRHVLGKLHDSVSRRSAIDAPELSALLRMLGSQDAYRRLYQTRSDARLVAELFLQQPDAPRSLYHNLTQIGACLRAITVDTREHDGNLVTHAIDDVLRLLRHVFRTRESDSPARSAMGSGKVSELLAQLLDQLYSLHPLLSDHYFSHQARVAESNPVPTKGD